MKRDYIIWFLFILMAFSSCKNKKVENSNEAAYIDTITKQAIQETKSSVKEDYSKEVEIDSPSVVFFMPEYRERQKIMQFYGDDAYSKMQLQQMFRNFYRLYRAVCPEVKKNNINCFFTYHWKFKIQTDTGYVFFDRKAVNQLFGFILADGKKPPQFYYGLYRIGQMEGLIRMYFVLPDFRIKQTFSLDQAPPIEGSP